LAAYGYPASKVRADRWGLAQLLNHLSLRNFDLLTPDLKDDIANYYSDLNASFATKKSTDEWQMTRHD
jgi:hypothetical protein